MDFAFYLNSALLGLGLSMDAFSVSLANGLSEPNMPKKRIFLISGTFAFFQALMPLLGWFLVSSLVDAFNFIKPFIPYAALVLLAFISGKMIIDGVKKPKESNKNANPEVLISDENAETPVSAKGTTLSLGALLLQGIATSIDALSVGFTIDGYEFLPALVCALIIATVTLIICTAGVFIGKRFGTKLADKSQILGGVILIAIGIEIFIKGLIG